MPNSPRRALYHRRRSPTQTLEIAVAQFESGELWGKPDWQTFRPTVGAFRGALPHDVEGIEFTTSAMPDSEQPDLPGARVAWSVSTHGAEQFIHNGMEYAKITISIRRVRYRTDEHSPASVWTSEEFAVWCTGAGERE